MKIRIRLAEAGDVPVLRELIEVSVRGLQAGVIPRRNWRARCERCMGCTRN